ncbi:methyltransferase domain-containing protein [Prosthecobacter sp.]|uniref:class I SAM-dependent methyltransferase n=1 Tax=Prosthecobacter sp. TaxID=1965333 RepID=UPI00378302AC
MNFLRPALRRFCFTFNTIRYRTEWPCLERALRRTPMRGVIFDGGAGSGEFLRRAMALGFSKGIALEYDAENFSKLQANAGRDPRVQIMQESLLAIPLPDASVDVVMSTQVIEHIEDHEKAAAEMCRILKPGGHAVITVPRPPEPFAQPDHVREGYVEEELNALFAPHGMRPMGNDWFLIQSTVKRMLRCARLPAHGMFVPVAWVDSETHLSPQERQARQPYGLLGLFQKTSA